MRNKILKSLYIILFTLVFAIPSFSDDPPPPPGGSTGAGDGTGGTLGTRNGAPGAPIDKKMLPLVLVLAVSASYGGYLLYRRGKEEAKS